MQINQCKLTNATHQTKKHLDIHLELSNPAYMNIVHPAPPHPTTPLPSPLSIGTSAVNQVSTQTQPAPAPAPPSQAQPNVQHSANLPLEKRRETKVSLNHATGLLEVYDAQTGKLVAVQESNNFSEQVEHKLITRLLPDGSRIMVEKSIDPLQLVNFQFKEYSSYVVDLICEKIVEGNSLTHVCTLPGFPRYTELCRWRRLHPEINQQLDAARKDRAEWLRDQAFKEAQAIDEATVSSDKARFEAMMKLAAVDDKEKFGTAKANGDILPVQIIVQTGIIRE